MSESERLVDQFSHTLREKCSRCGGTTGYIRPTNQQLCLYCTECGKFQYNAPKSEVGLAPESVQSTTIPPALRYLVGERAHWRCEFCGRANDDSPRMDVGHLLSRKDCQEANIPTRFVDVLDNLAWLCAECNAGMGSRSLRLHDLLRIHICRILAAERAP